MSSNYTPRHAGRILHAVGKEGWYVMARIASDAPAPYELLRCTVIDGDSTFPTVLSQDGGTYTVQQDQFCETPQKAYEALSASMWVSGIDNSALRAWWTSMALNTANDDDVLEVSE